MPPASTSAWIWNASHSLYYNASTGIWAKPSADGSWEYSTPAATASNRKQADYSDLDAPIADQLPEEQVWPDEEPLPQDVHATTPLLRLVLASRSPLIPAPQAVALLDPTEPVSIGRDRSYNPRIRLKELPVSKDHCTVCWVEEDVREGKSVGYWAVVDNGSTHGTFLRPAGTSTGQEHRLSESKVASAPNELRHLDTLRVGSTSFIVHIHASLACSDCALATDSSNLISLVSVESTATKEVASDSYVTRTKAQKEQDRRDKMRGLKEQFLKPTVKAVDVKITSDDTPTPPKTTYINRAAARRSRTGAAPPAASPSPFFSVPGSRTAPDFASAPTPAPSDPFNSTSKGAVLLSKLGGSTPGGLGTLIQPKSFTGGSREERPGLGSRPLTVGASETASASKRDWREDVRDQNRKRFKEM